MDRPTFSVWASHFYQRLFQLGAAVALSIFALVTCCGEAAGQTDQPSWKTGKSSWNGAGYDSASSGISVASQAIDSGAQAIDSAAVAFDDIQIPKMNVPKVTFPEVTMESVAPAYNVPVGTPELNIGPQTNPYASPYAEPVAPVGYQTNPYAATGGVSTASVVSDDLGSGAASLIDPYSPPPFADPIPAVVQPYGLNDVRAIPSDLSMDNSSVDLSQGTGPITKTINRGSTFVQPPLQEETLAWYQYPWLWMTQGWTNHFELGLDGSQGNAETLAFQIGTEIKRKTDDYTLAFDFDYRLANARNVTTEDNGRFNIDFDRLLNDTPWAWFGKFGLEFDEFKAFDLRLNLGAGASYHWIRNDNTTFVTRFGAGASQEIGAPDEDWVAEAIFGLDLEHQVNKYNKIRAKVDYFPEWEDFTNFRLVTDLGWEILLNEEESLSLKFAITDRYDSTPQGGADRNDFYYSVLLLVKF